MLNTYGAWWLHKCSATKQSIVETIHITDIIIDIVIDIIRDTVIDIIIGINICLY